MTKNQLPWADPSQNYELGCVILGLTSRECLR